MQQDIDDDLRSAAAPTRLGRPVPANHLLVRRALDVVHDQGDDEIPLSEGLAIAAAWKDSKLFVTERYGHRRILIAKDVIRESIQFMNQCKSLN